MGSYEDSLNENRILLGLPVSQPYSDSPGNEPAITPASPGLFPSWAGDAANDLLRGTVGAASGVVGLADMLTGNRVGPAIKEHTGYDPKRTNEFLRTQLSPERLQSDKEVADTKGFFPSVQAYATHPRSLLGTVTEAIPQSLGTVGVIKPLLAKFTASLLASRGLTAGTAEAMAFLSDPAIKAQRALFGAGVGGTAEGGLTAGNIQQEGMAAGKSWGETVGPAAAGGALTGLISALGARIPGLGDVESKFAMSMMPQFAGNNVRTSMLRKGWEIAKGMFKEGPLEELPQSAQEQLFTNLATGKPWSAGIPEASAAGLMTGTAMGGGMSGATQFLERGGRVPQNQQVSGQRLSDIFQTDVGGPAIEPGLPALPPDSKLTYLGRREYPHPVPPGLPEPTNMLPEPVDSMGNRLPYTGSVPPAPELGPNEHSWFGYPDGADEQEWSQSATDITNAASSVSRAVDLTNSPAQPPASGTTTPQQPIDLTVKPREVSNARAVDETSKISSLLDETTDLVTQAHPTTGDLVILDPDKSLINIMQPGGALFNETSRSWMVPRSRINDLIPTLQAAAPMPDTNLASKSLETAASNAVGQPVQFGDVVARRGKTKTPEPTSSEISPIEQMINQQVSEQPLPAETAGEGRSVLSAEQQRANDGQSRMNNMLQQSGLGDGRLAVRAKQGPVEGAVEPRTGITMLDGRYTKAKGAGDLDASGREIKAAPYSQEIRDRQGKSWMAESETMNPAAGESARSIQKLSIYHPENNATGTPERIIMSGTEGWRTSGKIPHAIDINNHYDANQDFFQFWPKAQAIAAANPSAHQRTVFSNLVRDQGYAGYVSDAEPTGRERWVFSYTPIDATPAMQTAKVGMSPVIQGVSKVPQNNLTELMKMSVAKKGKIDKVINKVAKTFPGSVQVGFRTSETIYYGEQSDNSDEIGAVIQLDNIPERSLSAFASVIGAEYQQNTILIASPVDPASGAKYNSTNVSFSLGTHSLDEVGEVMRTLKAPFNIVRESDGSLTMEYLVPKGDDATMQKFVRAAKIFAADGKLTKDKYFSEFIPKDQYHARINTYFGSTEGTARYNAAEEAGKKHVADVKSGRFAAGPQGSAQTSVQADTESAAKPRLTIHEQLTKIAAEVGKKLPSHITIEVIYSPQDLPQHAREQMAELSRDSIVYGYMDHMTNTVYLVESSITNAQTAYEILAHELITHYGLYKMLGEAKFTALMDKIHASMIRDPVLLKTALELNKSYKYDRNTKQGQRSLAEELVAYTSETGLTPSWYQEIIASIRQWLREMGLQVSWTDQDIRSLLRKSSDWLFDGEGGKYALQNARGNFLAKKIGVLDSGTAIIKTDKLAPAAPSADVRYLANGKAVPLLKDLPADPSVQKLWAGVNSVVRSLMDQRRLYEGLNRSMVEDMLSNKPQLSGKAAAAWTDLQNFYASVLGTSTEPNRVKITTETTDMPERMARFAVRNAEDSPLDENDFWAFQAKPYWINARNEVNAVGLELLPDIRKNHPEIIKRSDELRAAAQKIIDEKIKTIIPPGLDTVGQGKAMELARQSAAIFKEFKTAVDAWKAHMLDAISYYSWKPGKTTPQVEKEGTTWMVNKKPMPKFDAMVEQHRYVRNVKAAMNGLMNKIWDGASAEDQKFARIHVEKQLKALGSAKGAWVPNMPRPVAKALDDLADFYRTFGWHQNPHPTKVEPKFAVRIKEMPFHQSPQGTTDKSSPARVYDEAVDPNSRTKNSWIRQSDAENNANRQLLIQFSTNLINKNASVNSSSRYYDALYSGSRPGYARLHDFWEIPQWMGFASHFLPNADVYVIQDMEEAKKFIAGAGYERVLSSSIDVNTALIKDLASTLPGVVFNVGGYTETDTFSDIPNISWHDSMQSFADSQGFPYSEGTDYHHFTGSAVIPRLTMSQGCLHKCTFCTVSKKLETTSTEVIDQQAISFADLDAGLVYLNDKTFGQAKNYEHLVNVRQSLSQTNPNFQGFIIQTTAASINKMSDQFLQDSGIKYVELGVESYNDLILQDLHKPHNTKLIDKAIDKLRNNNIKVIPNIIIGLPAETADTYAATQEFLERNSDVISHANIYNLAPYKGSELASKITSDDANDIDENVMTKSFHVDKKIHADFSESVFSFGQKQLGRPSGKFMAKGGKIGKNEGNLVKQYLINKYQGQEMVGAKFLPMHKWNGPDSKYKVYTTFLNKPVTDEGSFQRVFADAQEWMKTSGQRPWTSQELMRYKEQIKKYVRDNNLDAEYKATKNRKDAFTFSEDEKRPSSFSQTVPKTRDVLKKSPSAWRGESVPYAVITVRDNGGSFLVRQGKPPSGPVATEYKLLRTLKTRPGEIFSLFIGNKESIPVGEWLTAEPLPTAGFADRPGWHTSKTPSTKHLSEANRVWAEVEVPATAEDRVSGKPPSPNGQYKFPRPASQGGEWTISGSMKVVKVLTPEEVEKSRSGELAVRLAVDNTKRHTVVRISDHKVVAAFPDQQQAWKFIDSMPKEDRGKHYYHRLPTQRAAEEERRNREGKFSIKVFHGTPTDFDKFDVEQINSRYVPHGKIRHILANGWGHYFTDRASMAKTYSKMGLSPKGFLIHATLHQGKDPSEYSYMDWKKIVSPELIKKLSNTLPVELKLEFDKNLQGKEGKVTGEILYNYLSSLFQKKSTPVVFSDKVITIDKKTKKGKPAEAYNAFLKFSANNNADRKTSELLLSVGIDGITFRALSDATITNYVVFSDQSITIDKKTKTGRFFGMFAVRNDVNGQFTQPNDRWYSQPLTLSDRFREAMRSVKDWWNENISPQLQHFKDLNYKDPSQLPIVEYLRQAEEIPRYARELVGRINQRLLVILKNPQDRDTYEHLSILRDMMREATIGMVFQRGPQQVTDFLNAQGYEDLTQLQNHIAHFESLITPAVNRALNLRKFFWNRWRRKAVDADILPDSILDNEDYFHHQVKQWQALNEQFSGTAPGMHKTKKSFQKGRTGFAGEYNLNYFESETGVLVDLITQVQTAKSLQDIRNDSKLNVLPLLVAEADRLNQAQAGANQAKETWKTVLKRGNVLDSFGNPITEQTHEFYKPVRGNFFHKVLTLTERSIRKVMEELQNVVGPDPTMDELMDIARIHAGTAIAAGLRQPLIENYMVLNRQIIRTMEKFQEQTDPTFLGRMTSYLQTQWKRWILFNPFRVTRYLLNNTTGDADIAFAFRPDIFKHIGAAYKELYAWAYKDSAGLTNVQRNKLETLNRKGVLGSGITVHEIPELSDETLSKLINDPRPHLIKRWFKGVHKFNNFRENIMRLAAWEYMNSEAQAGRFDALNYAASKKTEIDAISSMDDKVVKMSRELIGDYGNLSYVGQKLRKYVIPFWSWTEINAPRYFKMMKNELRAGNTRGGLKIAGVLGAKAAVRAGAFAALVMAWNFAFFRDEEEEMRRLGRDQLHLILGRHSDGSVISLRVQGSFSDTLGWIGAENLLEEIRSLRKGRVTPTEEAKSIAMAPVKKLIGGITPLYKTAAEAATGKTLFPDPLNPRPIRDKFQHVMKGMGLDFVTDRWVSGKPAPPLFGMKTIASPFLYLTDTHEAAYFHSIKLANDWLKDQGMPRTSSEPTPRSNALYYWRQATKLKDKDAEVHYKALYLKLGGQEKGMKQSIKHTDPLVVIPLKHRAKFLSSMGEDNKKTWRLGVRWWQETFKGYPHAPGNSSDSEN